LDDDQLFDAPSDGTPPRKPLLTAAKKAEEKQRQQKAASARKRLQERRKQQQMQPFSHLNNMNQPKHQLSDDEKSLDDDDLFDLPTETTPAKPLLAAAKKAQEHQQRLQKAEQRQREKPEHLVDMNQPKDHLSEDERSLDDDELFDPHKEPGPDKPLLAAAKKAHAQQEHELAENTIEERRRQSQKEPFSHLKDLNQPKKEAAEDDAKSLDADELFDEPETGPPPRRPLVAAAKVAKEQLQKQHQEEEEQGQSPNLDESTSSINSGQSADSRRSEVLRRIEERRLRRQKEDGTKKNTTNNNNVDVNKSKEEEQGQSSNMDESTSSINSGLSADSGQSEFRRRIEERRLRRQQEDGTKENTTNNNVDVNKSDAEIQSQPFDHLKNINQPTATSEDDNKSLDDDELFLDSKPEPSATRKPSVEAAKKAHQQTARQRLEERRKQRDLSSSSNAPNCRTTVGVSDRVEQQRQKAEAARKRLEERRKTREVKGRQGGLDGKESVTGSGVIDSAPSASTASRIMASRSRSRSPGRTGAAIERSRARRARLARSRSSDV
jgi:hypothetical protein